MTNSDAMISECVSHNTTTVTAVTVIFPLFIITTLYSKKNSSPPPLNFLTFSDVSALSLFVTHLDRSIPKIEHSGNDSRSHRTYFCRRTFTCLGNRLFRGAYMSRHS